MMNSLYEFDSDDAYRFANWKGIQTKNRGNELSFHLCPFCNGGTGSKRDTGTFSISLKTGQCECKRSGCRYKGNMITLAKDTGFELSEDVNRYYNINSKNDKFRTFRDSHRKIESSEDAAEYLQKRGISQKICKQYEITTKNNNILVFPFKNEKGELKFIKYRKTDFDKTKDRNKEWCESNCMPILFGMNHADPADGPLIITEGQIDSLSVAEAGLLNAVSVPTGCNGFTWVAHCWDWFQSFPELIIFGDCEKGHITLSELSKKFNGPVRIVRIEDYRDCKDANEILNKYGAEAIIKAVNNAELVPDVHIKSLADVEDIDLDNLESISTGIQKIDEILSGGFHAGELILLTGKRGDGKSTFMSQLVSNALPQNINTFVYSGELTDSFFKAWIDKQIIGKWNILPSEADRLRDFYRNRIFIYDNTISDGNELENLTQTVETAIKQYDCKLICIDNLMTAIETDTNEKLYRMQSTFVGALKKIAKNYNVVVILVAHPRKSNGYEFQNDDVSGSSDITNKVDVVMSYSRPSKDEDEGFDEFCRKLLITKNRLTGKLTNDRRKIFLYYSDSSKRIVGEDKNFDIDTGWQGDEPIILAAEEEEIPFNADIEDNEE